MWSLFFLFCFVLLFMEVPFFVCWVFLFGLVFFFWPPHVACGILLPWLGIEPGPLALKAQNPNHWTTRNSHGSMLYVQKSAHVRVQLDESPQTEHTLVTNTPMKKQNGTSDFCHYHKHRLIQSIFILYGNGITQYVIYFKIIFIYDYETTHVHYAR